MKIIKLFFVSIFLGCAFIGLSAQGPDQARPIPVDPSIKVGKLENGLTYYIKQNKKPEQRIELRLAVNAGSICENNSQLGLAHFVEHMCFNGTKNFPSNKIINMLEEMGVKFGAEINAYTGFDETVYMLKVPTDKPEWINRGFQVLEDWAHQVSMEEAEIDKERRVIVEEWRQGLGANDRMRQVYFPVLFKGSKYAERIPIGSIDVIKTFPYDTLRSFYRTWYRPDLMAVVVVGDIDPVLAEEKIREYFGRIPASKDPKPRINDAIPGNKDPLISVVTDKEATGFSAQIMFKQPAEKNVSFSDYRANLARSLYTSMLGRRLQEIGQTPDAPFLYAGAGYGTYVGRTIDVYSLSLSAKENQIEKSLDLILTENERVRQFGFTASELEREKKSILSMYENMAKESNKTQSASYASEFIRNFLTEECIPGIQKEYAMTQEYLPGISLQEVNALSQKWVTDENIICLITAQQKEGTKVPSEAQVLGIIKSVKNKTLTAYTDKVSDAPLLTEVPKGTRVVKTTENKEFGFTELTFANGVRMILKPTDYKNDEILFSAFSPGGTSLYPDSDIMSATFATNIISQSGLGDFDVTGLQKKLSGNTARLNPYIYDLREGVSGNCSPKDLETLLQLNYLYSTKIRKDNNAFNTYISRMKNTYKPVRTVPQAIFSDTLSKIISQNSPRVVAIPSEAQLDRIDLDRLIAIFKDRFADASDFTYLMIGNFKVEDVIPLLEKYIGGLPSIKRKETWKDVTPKFPQGLVKVDVPKNSEPQSVVAMVWKGDFNWNDKDRQCFSMLMNVLSIKLRESMREDQGGVYGVSVSGSTVKFPKPGYSISAQWGCSPDNIGKLSQTVLDEMGKIKNDGPAESDLNKVKETLFRERETRMKENSFWLASLQNHYYYGDKLLSLDDYKNFVSSITPADIKAIANKYLNTQKYVQVALTPAPKAEAK